ncbi:MAG: PVC-type heme-binding CxxCH protein [Verrucomicrobiales bacterium]
MPPSPGVETRLNHRRAVHVGLLAAACLRSIPSAPALEPVPPSMFHLSDPNLEVTIWAQSPQFLNPTNIDIDARGRIWVAEGVNYRKHLNRKPEGDRIMVLEDTDGDGKADKSWPFVQDPFLRAPMGVAVIGNKVVVSMAPGLVVFTDADGDAVFDLSKGDTQDVLLVGFNGRNHDHSLHSVTVGPDGKWYFSVGNCGAVFTDKDGKTWRIGAGSQDVSWWPKDPAHPDRDPKDFGGQKSDDGRVYVGGFIARMNPDGTGVEILAHNLRNSYENCVTSFGDIFASDNDDQPACRTFAVIEGANYGFASRDGWRSWQADRRPGQSLMTASWRQHDPGVAPAGDIYGGGAPTGIVFYENGALGPHHEGTLLLCESARNTIFGYKPERQGAGWKLERFDFLTTNKDGKASGTDYTGGDRSARAEDVKTLFRPSDIAVGPDGALYIADWLDPRIGGHNDLDDSLGGTIYRVAPKGFRGVVPKLDLTSVEGAIKALKSPAVHVRALGAAALGPRGKPDNLNANGVRWRDALEHLRSDDSPGNRFPAARAFQLQDLHGMWHGSNHPSQISMRSPRTPIPGTRHTVENLAGFPRLPTYSVGYTDRHALEAWGLACEGKESEVYDAVLASLGDPDPLKWSVQFAALAWRLHPPQAVPGFKVRAMASALPERMRLDALTAIAFNDSAEAAAAMLGIAVATKGESPAGEGSQNPSVTPTPTPPVHATAVWWLINKKDAAWKAHGVAAALKSQGLYDPETLALTAVTQPDPPPAGFAVEDVLKLTGDTVRGATTSQRCLMCHRIGEAGVDFGPDMTGWGKTQPAEVIARALIDPGADIAHGFHGTRLDTRDGVVIEGLLINDADPVIIQSMGGLTQTVPRDRIKSKAPLPRSLMLSAAALGLTAQDVADLVSFLRL